MWRWVVRRAQVYVLRAMELENLCSITNLHLAFQMDQQVAAHMIIHHRVLKFFLVGMGVPSRACVGEIGNSFGLWGLQC